MGKIHIYELAQQMGPTNKQLLEEFRQTEKKDNNFPQIKSFKERLKDYFSK